MKRCLTACLSLPLVLLAASITTAQITITSTDLNNILMNSTRMNYTMTYYPYPVVDLGSPSGSAQTFNFSGLTGLTSKDSATMQFVPPAGQPGASEFPTATICSPTTFSISGMTISYVLYFRLQSDGLYQLGTYSRQQFPPFIDTTAIEKNTPPQIVIPLPLTYGTSRTGVDTVVHDAVNGDFTVTTSMMACDGWGDITFPETGAAPKVTLVNSLRATETRIEESYVGGTFSDRTRYVSVTYLTADGSIVSVDQPDSAYTGGNADVTDISYSYKAGAATAVDDSPTGTPEGYSLSQNYPNPFNPSTTIAYSIPAAGHVRLSVFDVLGREVATLVDRQMSPGSYEATFDATGLPSGLYLYRLVSGSFVETRKLNVLK